MPTDTAPQIQEVQGPDGKSYKFSKSITPARIDKYFQKQGWIKKDGQWYTQSGEPAKRSVPSSIPAVKQTGIMDRHKIGLDDPHKISMPSATATSALTSLSSIGGGIGGTVGGKPGAALGGMVGEGASEIARRILYSDTDMSAKQSAMRTLVAGAKQLGLQYAGEKVGDVFFSLLNKIPHAEVKQGIKLLPSDLNPDSKVMRYIEDLLSNLVPSAGTIAKTKAEQSASIVAKADKIANGFAKFNGTSEEMGVLLQKTLRTGQEQAEEALDKLRLSLPAGKRSAADLAKAFPNQVKEFQETYANELSRSIIRTNKPELIAGWLRTPKAGLADTRIVTDVVHELDKSTLGKVQNRILRDVINETLTGSKDPTAKGVAQLTKQYSGNKFKQVIDGIGEEKLKAIYGEQGFKKIENFVKLTGNVGNGSAAGAGKFLNLIFLLPFRQGLGLKGTAKVAGTALFANRMAKIITSPEGMRMYENGIRAFAAQAPRAINLVRDEAMALSEQADKEYAQEEKEAEEEYNKEHKK